MLDGVKGIRFCHFEDVDVVRHHLVQRIVRAYDSYGRAQQQLPLTWRLATLSRPPGWMATACTGQSRSQSRNNRTDMRYHH